MTPIPKATYEDEVMEQIRRVSRANGRGYWDVRVKVDITDFDYDTTLPNDGEVCDGDLCGQYLHLYTRQIDGRSIATYITFRDPGDIAAYAPGARR